MTISQLTPPILAAKFSELLREHLTKKQMATVISRNRREPWPWPQFCHSHDFVDANVIMDDAFKALLGHTACDTVGETSPPRQCDCMSARALELWNAAWYIAKKAEFVKEKCLA
jgi:hypothetical protein